MDKKIKNFDKVVYEWKSKADNFTQVKINYI